MPALAEVKAGFHPIASWFVALDLCDDIDVQPLGSGHSKDGPSRFEIAWAADAPRPSPIDWPVERDLAFRAHAALEAAIGRSLPVHARVTKRIPVGGGLGGGSSDAAAMLVAVDRAFDLRLGHAKLSAIGQTLGSDVAFFLDDEAESASAERVAASAPRPAIVTGLGERIERTPRLDGQAGTGAWLVLLLPPFGCATGAVYRAFDALKPGPVREDSVRALARSAWPPVERGPRGLFNDLTAAACAVEPCLAELMRHAERALDRPVHMTGSGSTLFVIAASAGDAHDLARTATNAIEIPAVATRLV